ncbi:hypothetical protein NZK35_00690 [Stieleria sp. ICT_E10.1]|uniref:hypothetical protein n=1 Tax=Stieleria sedimenti TaxID=2976331 RepID=UPI00217F7CAA|nr:hypothetical protein [Stieleria sedimenti]MCS7465185.1 hypothetical protein [Stieleria sedimenti]
MFTHTDFNARSSIRNSVDEPIHPVNPMNEPIRMLRRDFVKYATSVASGLGISGVLFQSSGADEGLTETASSLNITYLEKGLNALARAHHMSSMAGHLGASLIAGYYVGLHPIAQHTGPQATSPTIAHF